MRRPCGDDPAAGQVPPLHVPVPQADVRRVGQVLAGALPVPHLTAGVPRILQDGGDRAQHPSRTRAVLVPGRAAADGHGTPASFKARAIRAVLCPASRWAKIHRTACAVSGRAPAGAPAAPRRRRPCSGAARHHPAGTPTAAAPPGTGPAPHLDRHRGPHPDTRPGDLPLRRQPQHRHRVLVMPGRDINPPARLRHPQLDAVMLEQRRHRRILAAVERPLVLPATTASQPRPGSASSAASLAASRRRPHATVRLSPASKNSATTCPRPPTSAPACSRCRARDVTRSCQSSVDTRP